MKKRVLSLFLSLAMILGIACFTVPASAVDTTPKQTEVKEWTYSEDFNGSSVPAGWSVTGATDTKVENSKLSFSNATNTEYFLKYDGSYAKKYTNYIIEIAFSTSGTGNVWLYSYLGTAYRVRGNFGSNKKLKMDYTVDTLTEKEIPDFSKVRFEYVTFGNRAECNVFLDGKYFATSYGNANNSAASFKFCTKGNAADPFVFSIDSFKFFTLPQTQYNVSDWDIVEEFNGATADLPTGWTKSGTVGDAVVDSGNLVITGTASGEEKVTFKSAYLKKATFTSVEFKAKMKFTSNDKGTMQFFSYVSNNDLRIQGQFGKSVIKIRRNDPGTSAVMDSVNKAIDEAYHVYRYDMFTNGDVVMCNMYMDGTFIMQSPMHTMNQTPQLLFIVNAQEAQEASMSVDYVKVSYNDGKFNGLMYNAGELLTGLSDDLMYKDGLLFTGIDEMENEYLKGVLIHKESGDGQSEDISNWTYNNDFDTLTSDIKLAKGNGSIKAEDGKLVITNSDNSETIVSIENELLDKCNKYSVEFSAKIDFPTESTSGRASFLSYLGNSYRIHSQFRRDTFAIQEDKLVTCKAALDDGQYHLFRYDVAVINGTATCKVYIDGKLTVTSCLNANNGAPKLQFVTTPETAGKTITMSVDYVRTMVVIPKKTEVKKWDYEEEFNGNSLPAEWKKESENGTVSVAEGNLVIDNNANAEAIAALESGKIKQSDGFVLEVKMKTVYPDTTNSRVSVIGFYNNEYRLHSQISSSKVRVQNIAKTFNDYLFDPTDGEYHIYRYEGKVENGITVCNVFIDGKYAYTCELNGMVNAKAITKIINTPGAEGKQITTYVDYVKYKAIVKKSPNTADDITVSAAIVAVVAAAAFSVIKKRKEY